MKCIKKKNLTRLIVFLLSLILTLGNVPVGAASKKVNVTTIKKLQVELGKNKAETIVFSTKASKTYTIKPVKNSKNKQLVIDAPNAKIINKSSLKMMKVEACKSLIEKANGNNIVLKDGNTDFTLASGKKIENLMVSSSKSNIILAKKSAIDELICKKTSAKVNMKVALGSKVNVNLSKKTSINISGSNKATVKVDSKIKNCSITVSVPVEVFAEKDTKLNFKAGSEGSIVDSSENANVKIANESKKDPIVKKEGKTVTETTVTPSSDVEKQPVVTEKPSTTNSSSGKSGGNSESTSGGSSSENSGGTSGGTSSGSSGGTSGGTSGGSSGGTSGGTSGGSLGGTSGGASSGSSGGTSESTSGGSLGGTSGDTSSGSSGGISGGTSSGSSGGTSGSTSGGISGGTSGVNSGENSGGSVSPSPADHTSPSPADPASPSPADPTSLSPADPTSPSPADPASPSPADPTSPSPADPTSPSPTDPTSPSPADPTSPSPADSTSPSPADPTSPSPADPTSPSPADPASPSPADPASPSPTQAVPGVYVIYDQNGARQMFTMINEFRLSNGINRDSRRQLVYDYNLEKAAMQRAAEIAVAYNTDNSRPDGQDYTVTLAEYGFDISPQNILYGENILFGTEDSMELANAFNKFKEDGSKESIIMLGYFRRVGVAHVEIDKVDFWVQVYSDELKSDDSENTGVDAFNGEKFVPINIPASLVHTITPEYVSGATTVEVGSTIDTPVYIPKVVFTGSKADAIKVAEMVFETGDEFVSVSNGKMTGLQTGTGHITATVLGKSVLIEIQVS